MNKREIISDAFSMLDDRLVTEAVNPVSERKDTSTVKRNGFISFAAAAAGIFVAVGAVYAVVNMNLNPIGTGGVVYSGIVGISTEPSDPAETSDKEQEGVTETNKDISSDEEQPSIVEPPLSDVCDDATEVHELDLSSTLTLEDVNVALKDKTYPERAYQEGEWIWPFDLKLLDSFTCSRGTSEDSGSLEMNISCLDITDVYAVKDGTVILTGENENGWYAVIYNGGGYTSFYSNLGELYVKEGQEVSQCDVIGVTGSFEEQIISNVHYRIPDLHFEINGEKGPVDESTLWRYYSSKTE